MFSRQRVTVAARLLATVVIAFVLVRRVHLSQVLPDRNAHNLALVVAALAFTLFGVVLSAFRWQRVLVALDVHSGLLQLTRHYLASLFVGNFLPSTVGGDVLRVTRLGAETGDTAAPFASVLLERMSGWIVLPGLAFTGLLINPTLRRLGHATAVDAGVGLVTLLLLGGVLIAVGNPRVGQRFSGAAGWKRFTGAIHLGVDHFRHHPAKALEVVAAGVVYQLSVLVAVFTLSKALEIHVGFTAILAFFPAVAILQTLPLTVGGLGVREGALYLFLHPLGVHKEQAIGLGLIYYFSVLIVSLIGAPAFAAGTSRRKALTGSAAENAGSNS